MNQFVVPEGTCINDVWNSNFGFRLFHLSVFDTFKPFCSLEIVRFWKLERILSYQQGQIQNIDVKKQIEFSCK
jgi:hypothetical protein